ncbi:DNA-binding transcriptional MerR regulator [Pontibacter aydingkolensis]
MKITQVPYFNRTIAMPYKEREIEKQYYTIGEVAEMFDVAASLIRFWETEFEQLRPKKNKKGNRQYTAKDIETLRTIYHLVKERGYTIQGAREVLKNKSVQTKDKIEIIESLEKVKAFLVGIKSQLNTKE